MWYYCSKTIDKDYRFELCIDNEKKNPYRQKTTVSRMNVSIKFGCCKNDFRSNGHNIAIELPIYASEEFGYGEDYEGKIGYKLFMATSPEGMPDANKNRSEPHRIGTIAALKSDVEHLYGKRPLTCRLRMKIIRRMKKELEDYRKWLMDGFYGFKLYKGYGDTSKGEKGVLVASCGACATLADAFDKLCLAYEKETGRKVNLGNYRKMLEERQKGA